MHLTTGRSLRNDDPGMTHDFTIAAWGVATRALTGSGVTDVVFTVPRESGSYPYRCPPHSQMMRGLVIVEP